MGKYKSTGKAPAAIVDLKAAVRYLKCNDSSMPGDAEKNISNGTSAGGTLSALLGATGNAKEYLPYLTVVGAANDNIFAVSAYCPITNLDNADMAYEWQFDGIEALERNGRSKNLSEEQVHVANDLKRLFHAYLNSLDLKSSKGEVLSLDRNGNGSFKDFVKHYVMASAQEASDSCVDLFIYIWISVQNGTVVDFDFNSYVRYLGRMKTPPAFDALDLATPENRLFGSQPIGKQHFTEYGTTNSPVNATKASNAIIRMMNPMYFIGKSKSDMADFWRIRHRTKDNHTSLAIAVILSTKSE